MPDAAIFGLIVADVIANPVQLRPAVQPGGLQLVDSITLYAGGNASNTGTAMAKLGADVAAVGMVGKDTLGEAALVQLRANNVNTDYVRKVDGAQTSATVVAVEPGGERCFFHTPGATAHLDPEFFQSCLPLFLKCKVLQIGYFGLLPTLTPHLPALITQLKKDAPNLKIALDTVNPPGAWSELAPILAAGIDIFAPSRSEAEALSGEKNPQKMITFFRRAMPTGLIAIKLDAEGCILDDTRDRVMAPGYKVDVKDTTGAGDTWFGGLLVALGRKMPLQQAGAFANRAAADCCTQIGASAGVKSFDETMARL